MADKQQQHNGNLIYWEKMKEARNLTYWLHVLAGTLICVEYPSIVEKKLVKDHIQAFVKIFFYSVECLFCYFVTSTALSLPSCGSIEFLLTMIFNAVASQRYISFVDSDRARYILLIWTISAAIVLIFTLEETWNQVYTMAGTTILRIRFILRSFWRRLMFLVKWLRKKFQTQVPQNQNQENQNQNQDQEPVQDFQDIYNANCFYFEKQRELRIITMWLHIISGTLVTLENPAIGVKKIMEHLNFLHFIDPFFQGTQILYLYYVLSIALCPPQSGTLEYVLVMIFNAFTCRFYVHYANPRIAKDVFKMWLAGAGSLLLYTLEDSCNQLKCMALTVKDRFKNVWTLIRNSPQNTMNWLHDH